LGAAGRAKLTGRIEPVYRDYDFAVPRSFVGQLSAELSPAGICDSLCQLMVSDHVFRRKVFDADDIVFSKKLRRQLMQHISSLVRDMLMKECHLDSGFFPAIAPLWFSGELTLETGQLLFGLGKVFGVRILHPI